MGTKVTVTAAQRFGEFSTRPDSYMQEAVRRACDTAQSATGRPFEPVRVLFTSSNIEVPGWQQEQRQVGSADVTCVIRAQGDHELLQSVLQRTQQLTIAAALTAKPQISNVATQVLNHALGERFRTTQCSKYTTLGEQDTRIQQLSSLTRTPAQSIISNADRIIERRNNMRTHFTSPALLEEEVLLCVQLIEAVGPALRTQCQWECWVLENFEHFKSAFPDLTQPVLELSS